VKGPVPPEGGYSIAVLRDRRGQYLVECLRRLMSVLAEARDVVLVNDGGPADVEATAAQALCPNLRVVSGHGDPAHRMNTAFAETRGGVVVLVSVFDLIREGCVERLLEFVRSTPDAAMAGASLLRENGLWRPSQVQLPRINILAAWRQVSWRLRLLMPGRSVAKPSIRVVAAPMPACVAIQRRAFDEVGAFATGWRFRFEMLEWSVRAREKGWRAYVLPAAEAFHVAPLMAGPIPISLRLSYEATRRRFIREHFGSGRVALLQFSRWLMTAGAMTFWGMASLATLNRSSFATHGLRSDAAVLRHWGKEVPPQEEAEQTCRWETAVWMP
jgi:GT2 family glycosyltransferase